MAKLDSAEVPVDKVAETASSFWIEKLLALSALALGIFLVVCHWFQFDALAAVTLVPPWGWLILVLLIIAVGYRGLTRPTLLAIGVVWILFTALFVEEARSMFRFTQQTVARDDSNNVRIVTLNCNIGSHEAVLETQPFTPDIVLVQESPGKETLTELSRTIFGEQSDQLCSTDASIICRGAIALIKSETGSHFHHALVTLPEGERFDVVSLRLSSPVFRLDPFSSGFWKDHLDKRLDHRRQIQEVIDHLQTNHVTDNWIVGGDFNLPGGGGATSPMKGLLEDSFLVAGTGWGGTGTSDYPLFRVDQIWLSPNLVPKTSKAWATKNSDHRMVVVDFPKPTGPQAKTQTQSE